MQITATALLALKAKNVKFQSAIINRQSLTLCATIEMVLALKNISVAVILVIQVLNASTRFALGTLKTTARFALAMGTAYFLILVIVLHLTLGQNVNMPSVMV